MSFCQQKQNNANTHKAHMLYKAGQLLLSLCYRLGNVEINDQSRKPARAPFPWFSVLHPRYHLGGGMRVQLCFTKTERALVMGNNRPAPEGGGTVPTAPPVFSPDDLSHFTGNHVCSRPSWELQPFNFQPQSWRWASAHGGVGAVRGAQPEQSSRPAWQWQPSPPPATLMPRGLAEKRAQEGLGRAAAGGWDWLRQRSHGDPMERRAPQPRFPCTFPAAGTLVGVGAPSSRQKTLADLTAQVKRCWRSPPFRLAGDSLFFALQLKQAVTSRKNSCRIALRFVRHPPPATSCQAHANPEPPFGTIKINAGSEKSQKSVLFCEALIT